MKKNYFILLFGILLSQAMFAQTTLYSEDFTGQNEKGAIGTSTNVSDVNWSIDVSSSSLSNGFFGFNADYFYVIGEAFAGKDTDGNAIWYSPSIDISGYTNVSLSMDAFTSGNNDNSDLFSVQYRINGGSWTTASTNGSLNNDFNLTVSQVGLTGNTLELRVQIDNDSDNEVTTFDNILVVGTFPCSTTPIDVSDLTATPNNEQIELNWTTSSCFDEVLVVAKSVSAVTVTPSGDGSSYTANSIFGSGTEIATDEFVVYKGTNNSVTTTSLTNGTTYHFEVFTRKGTNWSSGVTISATANLSYCNVVGDLTYNTAITLVDFGTINNTTGQDLDDGYSDFTNQSTTVTKGTSEDLTVNLDTDGNYLVYSYAWIDWNQDGDFEDSGETYDLGYAQNTSNGPTSLSALSVSIPTYAATGNTRLRVLCQYYNGTVPTNGPCDGSSDGEIEDYTINVTGTVNYTYNNGWSPSNPIGVSNTVDTISIVSGNAIISSNTSCNTATVSAGAGLTIDAGVTLTTNDLTLESNSTSYSSLILDGTISGTINYERHVNVNGSGVTGSNDLVSAPLTGQAFNNFATANPNILNNGTLYLFGPFDKTTGQYVTYAGSATTPLEAGIGYRAGTTDNGTVTFTGTAENTTISIDIINSGPTEPAEQEWNLVGNPYPSYLNVQAFFNHEVSTGVPNLALFNPTTAAIFGYDGDATDGWVIYNLATTTSSTVIAPGQGFFVSANAVNVAAYDLEFTPAMRRTGTSDDFIAGRNAELVYLKLNLSSATNASKTEIYFNTNASLGFDLGYDTKVWGDTPTEFAIYSHLVQDNTNDAMALQTLHSTDVSNATIPLGVNANQGEQLTFSIADMNVPASVKVYLEDVVTNTVTLLNTSDYIITPATPIHGTGRFFLRTSDEALSTIENNLDTINIIALNRSKELVVSGQLQEQTLLSLYDIQGRNVLTVALNSDTLKNRIDVSNINQGVYVATVKHKDNIKTQKLVIN